MLIKKRLRVLLFEEEGFWYAQAIENDIMARGKDIDDVKSNFMLTLKSECEQKGGLDRIRQAPDVFLERWKKCAVKKNQFPEFSVESGIEFRLAA